MLDAQSFRCKNQSGVFHARKDDACVSEFAITRILPKEDEGFSHEMICAALSV